MSTKKRRNFLLTRPKELLLMRTPSCRLGALLALINVINESSSLECESGTELSSKNSFVDSSKAAKTSLASFAVTKPLLTFLVKWCTPISKGRPCWSLMSSQESASKRNEIRISVYEYLHLNFVFSNLYIYELVQLNYYIQSHVQQMVQITIDSLKGPKGRLYFIAKKLVRPIKLEPRISRCWLWFWTTGQETALTEPAASTETEARRQDAAWTEYAALAEAGPSTAATTSSSSLSSSSS